MEHELTFSRVREIVRFMGSKAIDLESTLKSSLELNPFNVIVRDPKNSRIVRIELGDGQFSYVHLTDTEFFKLNALEQEILNLVDLYQIEHKIFVGRRIAEVLDASQEGRIALKSLRRLKESILERFINRSRHIVSLVKRLDDEALSLEEFGLMHLNIKSNNKSVEKVLFNIFSKRARKIRDIVKQAASATY